MSLGRLKLAQQPVERAAQGMRGIGRARSEYLGLKRTQAPAAHSRTQVLATHPVTFLLQAGPEPAGAVVAFVLAKDLGQRRFLSRRFTALPGPLRAGLPCVIAAQHTKHLAKCEPCSSRTQRR